MGREKEGLGEGVIKIREGSAGWWVRLMGFMIEGERGGIFFPASSDVNGDLIEFNLSAFLIYILAWINVSACLSIHCKDLIFQLDYFRYLISHYIHSASLSKAKLLP